MRFVIAAIMVVFLIGCDSQRGEDTQVNIYPLQDFAKLEKAEFMFFGDTGWSMWKQIDVGSGNEILDIFRNCPVIRYDCSGVPGPSLPPPNWAIKFNFKDTKELEFEILGSGSLVRMEVENSTEILEAEPVQEDLVDLLEELEKSTAD